MISCFALIQLILIYICSIKFTPKLQTIVFVAMMFFSILVLVLGSSYQVGLLRASENGIYFILPIEIFCALYGLWCLSSNEFSLPNNKKFILTLIFVASFPFAKLQILAVVINLLRNITERKEKLMFEKKAIATFFLSFCLFLNTELDIKYLDVIIVLGICYHFLFKIEKNDHFNLIILIIVALDLKVLRPDLGLITVAVLTLSSIQYLIGEQQKNVLRIKISNLKFVDKKYFKYINLKTSFVTMQHNEKIEKKSIKRDYSLSLKKVHKTNSLELVGYLLTIINLIVLITMVKS